MDPDSPPYDTLRDFPNRCMLTSASVSRRKPVSAHIPFARSPGSSQVRIHDPRFRYVSASVIFCDAPEYFCDAFLWKYRLPGIIPNALPMTFEAGKPIKGESADRLRCSANERAPGERRTRDRQALETARVRPKCGALPSPSQPAIPRPTCAREPAPLRYGPARSRMKHTLLRPHLSGATDVRPVLTVPACCLLSQSNGEERGSRDSPAFRRHLLPVRLLLLRHPLRFKLLTSLLDICRAVDVLVCECVYHSLGG